MPARRQVATGTGEITRIQPLLDPLNLADVVVTANARHITRSWPELVLAG